MKREWKSWVILDCTLTRHVQHGLSLIVYHKRRFEHMIVLFCWNTRLVGTGMVLTINFHMFAWKYTLMCICPVAV